MHNVGVHSSHLRSYCSNLRIIDNMVSSSFLFFFSVHFLYFFFCFFLFWREENFYGRLLRRGFLIARSTDFYRGSKDSFNLFFLGNEASLNFFSFFPFFQIYVLRIVGIVSRNFKKTN